MPNDAPTITVITTPTDPVSITAQPITVVVEFVDPDGSPPYTCSFDYDDNGVVDQTVTSVSGSPCQGTHTYSEPGVYTVTVTVTDNGNAPSDPRSSNPIVIFDPSGGFVTGGGWFLSPPGAFVADPSATGKAIFAFVSKYRRGASTPTGKTEFQFQAGNLNFHSDQYEWLIVNRGGSRAQFKGAGTINGALAPTSNYYYFMVWADDSVPDTFRIRIWWEDVGVEYVVYDNGVNQPINAGSIVIHTGR